MQNPKKRKINPCAFFLRLQYGFGQWHAIKMAIRRSPVFRFDYFLRSVSIELLGKRCEQLMKAAEKEVEQLERKAREHAGLTIDHNLPDLSIMREQMRASKKEKVETERTQLEEKLAEVEKQIKEIQDNLKAINESDFDESIAEPTGMSSPTRDGSRGGQDHSGHENENQTEQNATENAHASSSPVSDDNGAVGPNGFLEFPAYDGLEPPKECKKAFTHFCLHTRKEVKASLDPAERKNKVSF